MKSGDLKGRTKQFALRMRCNRASIVEIWNIGWSKLSLRLPRQVEARFYFQDWNFYRRSRRIFVLDGVDRRGEIDE